MNAGSPLLADPPCPCCGSSRIEPFFSIPKAPIFSLVTMKSREEALAVPRRDIELGFCHDCGFVFNRLFDRSIDYFSLGYEDQQGFSKTFMAFLSRISDDLIERHALRGKTLLEIGCGKGDFINLLAGKAAAKGIGVDPAYEEGRQTNPDLVFYREIYGPQHGRLGADFICCRHTLEHIPQAREFLHGLRDSIPSGRTPAVFFEVPDVGRILDLPAFWDIYYEHCSYFSPGSLARALRNCGLRPTALRLDYGDQYVLIEAVPDQPGLGQPLALEESVEVHQARMRRFQARVRVQLDEWRSRLGLMKAQRQRVVVWGGGSKAVGFLTQFADLSLVEHVVDINPHMQGNFIPGIGCQYVRPDFLATYRPDVVIIMNGVYEKEITASLHAMGVRPEVLAL
jgi:SAM-dependent methyltransferase